MMVHGVSDEAEALALVASLESATQTAAAYDAAMELAMQLSLEMQEITSQTTMQASAGAAIDVCDEDEEMAIVLSLSEEDARVQADAEATSQKNLDAALDATLRAALESEVISPLAPMPSIVSQQISRGRFPPFTAVPATAARGISTETELALLQDDLVHAGGVGDATPPRLRAQTSAEVREVVARLEEEEHATRQAMELGPTFSCQICLEESIPLLKGHALSCGCQFCVPCVGEHVRVKIRGHEVSSEALTCPSCTHPLSIADVHALTWRCGDDETWRQFEAVADDAMIESLVRDGGARRCPAERCNYAFVWSPGDAVDFECPACAASFCLCCPCVDGGVGPPHRGQSCAAYQEKLRADADEKRRLDEWRVENARADERFTELMRREMRAGDTKPCPRCKQAITKAGGCHHHKCTSCKLQFCWNCGGFNPEKPNTNTCSTTCSKSRRVWWTERDLFGEPSAGLSGGGGESSSSTASENLRAQLFSHFPSIRLFHQTPRDA